MAQAPDSQPKVRTLNSISEVVSECILLIPLQLVINSKTFFKNNVEVDKWVRHRLFAKLRKTVDKEKWV